MARLHSSTSSRTARLRFATSSQVSRTPGRLLSKASTPGTLLLTAALKNCKTIRRSQFPNSLFRVLRVRVPLREPVSPIHHAARRDRAADGGDLTRRYRCLYPVTGLGTARGRLPHHSSRDVLSWRQPNRDGDDSNCAARTAVWSTAGAQPDDLHQFGRNLGHRPAV